jgi:hypothetical protein
MNASQGFLDATAGSAKQRLTVPSDNETSDLLLAEFLT